MPFTNFFPLVFVVKEEVEFQPFTGWRTLRGMETFCAQ